MCRTNKRPLDLPIANRVPRIISGTVYANRTKPGLVRGVVLYPQRLRLFRLIFARTQQEKPVSCRDPLHSHPSYIWEALGYQALARVDACGLTIISIPF